MNRDALLNKISIRMTEINQRLTEIYQEKSKLIEEKGNLIESWEKETNISRDELESEE